MLNSQICYPDGVADALLSVCEQTPVAGLQFTSSSAALFAGYLPRWCFVVVMSILCSSARAQDATDGSQEAFSDEEINILPRSGESLSPLAEDGLDTGYYADTSACDCPNCQATQNAGQRMRRPLLIGPGRCFMLYDMRVTADYLLYSIGGMDVPALVTTSPVGTAAANIGVLGANTQTLFGGNTINDDVRSGGRVALTLWTDPTLRTAWEVSYLGLEHDGDSFAAISDSSRNLARPVFDTGTNSEAAQIVAQTGVLAGSINVNTDTQLQAFEVLRRGCYWRTPCSQYDLLLGYKYGLLEDSLYVNQSSTYVAASGPIVAGTTSSASDRFNTSNQFNGLLIGLDRWHTVGCWKFSYTGKVALGANRSRVDVQGRTTNTVPNVGSSTFTGNLLAQSSNIGRFERDQFMAIPEFTFRLERRMSPQIQLHAGYNLMYWSAVTRVDDVLGRRVSQFPPEAITGSREPAFRWNDSGLFMHGLQVGMDYNF